MKLNRPRVFIAAGISLFLGYLHSVHNPSNIQLDMSIFLTKVGYAMLLLMVAMED